MTPEAAHNISFVGHTDCNGHGDCVQVMISRGYAYLGRHQPGCERGRCAQSAHAEARGCPAESSDSWCLHCQAAEDLLLVVEELDLKALLSIKDYYSGSTYAQVDSRRYGERGKDYSAGCGSMTSKIPPIRSRLGFWKSEWACHRIWWTGGRYAYASALLDGLHRPYPDHC